jgi:hypothetical protein
MEYEELRRQPRRLIVIHYPGREVAYDYKHRSQADAAELVAGLRRRHQYAGIPIRIESRTLESFEAPLETK